MRLKNQILLTMIAAITLWVIAASCSSVTPVQGEFRTKTVEPPDVTSDRSAGGVFLGKDDFKSRSTPTEVIRLVVVPEGQHPVERKSSPVLPETVTRILRMKLLSHIRRADVTLVEPPAELVDSLPKVTDQIQDFLKNNKVDGLLHMEVTEPDSGRYVLESKILDPYDRSVMGELLIKLRGNTRGSVGRQIDFFLGRDSYYFLNDEAYMRFAFTGLNREVVDRFVRSSITANVNFIANDPEIKFYLQNDQQKVLIGQTPVERRLREGLYTIFASKKGMPDQRQDFLVRAGREQVVLFSDSGDSQATSLALYTSPPGLRLSLDGVVRGNTPFFRTGMEPGLYQAELAEDRGNNRFVVVQNFFLDVSPGKFNELLYMINYSTERGKSFFEEGVWNTVSSDRLRVIERADGFGFFTPPVKGKEDETVGIVSRPLAPESFRASVEIPSPAVGFMLVGFTSEEDTILVEVTDDRMKPLHFKQGTLQKPVQAFDPLEGKKKKTRKIEFRFDRESRVLTVRLDGDRVLEKEVSGTKPMRMTVLTDRAQANGGVLFKNLQFESSK